MTDIVVCIPGVLVDWTDGYISDEWLDYIAMTDAFKPYCLGMSAADETTRYRFPSCFTVFAHEGIPKR